MNKEQNRMRAKRHQNNNKNHEPIRIDYLTLPEIQQQLNGNWDVGQRQFTSHRSLFGKIIVLYKKFIFTLLKLPLCNFLEDQRNFNAQATQGINLLARHQELLKQRYAESAKKLEGFIRHQNKQLIERTDFLFNELVKKTETLEAKLQTLLQNQRQLEETILRLSQTIQEEQENRVELEKPLATISSHSNHEPKKYQVPSTKY